MDIPHQAVTALVGSNGSGKSTLLEALAGTLRPSRGRIEGLPRDIAYVPQRSQVSDGLPVTVRRTVEMGRWRSRGAMKPLKDTDRRIVEDSMIRMGIDDLAPRRLGDLSGGQRQRVLIAQGLAQRAPLLLLDEPLAAVDASAAHYIRTAILDERNRGVTVLIATHDPSQTAEADKVIKLVNGRL